MNVALRYHGKCCLRAAAALVFVDIPLVPGTTSIGISTSVIFSFDVKNCSCFPFLLLFFVPNWSYSVHTLILLSQDWPKQCLFRTNRVVCLKLCDRCQNTRESNTKTTHTSGDTIAVIWYAILHLLEHFKKYRAWKFKFSKSLFERENSHIHSARKFLITKKGNEVKWKPSSSNFPLVFYFGI